jgi:hypothetical protein
MKYTELPEPYTILKMCLATKNTILQMEDKVILVCNFLFYCSISENTTLTFEWRDRESVKTLRIAGKAQPEFEPDTS